MSDLDPSSCPSPGGLAPPARPRAQPPSRAPRWQVIETPPPVRARGPVVRAEAAEPVSALRSGGWSEDEAADQVPVPDGPPAAGDEWSRGDEPPTLLPAPRRAARVDTPPPYLSRRGSAPEPSVELPLATPRPSSPSVWVAWTLVAAALGVLWWLAS